MGCAENGVWSIGCAVDWLKDDWCFYRRSLHLKTLKRHFGSKRIENKRINEMKLRKREGKIDTRYQTFSH